MSQPRAAWSKQCGLGFAASRLVSALTRRLRGFRHTQRPETALLFLWSYSFGDSRFAFLTRRNRRLAEIAKFSTVGQLASLIVFLLTPTASAIGQVRPAAHEGPWDVSIWVASATGEETQNSFRQSQIWTGGLYLGKVITSEVGRGWRRFELEYGFDFVPLFVQSGNARIVGGGFDPVILRFNSGHQLGRIRPYIELAGGAVLTTSNLPPGNTSAFNFTVRGGGGVYLTSKKRRSWDLGCRYFHISNANLANRNPEFNGIQISVGYHWLK
jgi:Lipid A 3-O-deacylase (PagL)